MESYVRQLLCELRDHGGLVNTTVIVGTAKSNDASLLAENPGEIDLSKDWAQRMMR